MVDGNPFLDDEDETQVPQGGDDNANFKQLRDYARKLERDNKAKEREIERLATYEAKDRVTTLKGVGLSEKHAALFLKVNAEEAITPELVQAFVTEYEIPVAQASETPAPAETPAPQASALPPEGIVELNPEKPTQNSGFAPTPAAGNAAGSVITEVQEAQKLAVDNPEEYARLREAGRIQLAKLPGSG